jgi:hypothetical protein
LFLTGRELCPPGFLEAKVLRGLLARLNLENQPVAIRIQLAIGSLVDRERGIDEIALVLREPLGTIECTTGLLTAGQSELDRAERPELLLAITHQAVDPDGRLGLVIHRAAGIEVSVLLDELEGIARPVGTLRLNDIEVCEEQDRLELGITPRVDRDEPTLLGVLGNGEGMQVRIGEARSLQVRRHAFGGEGTAARRQ